MEKMYTPTPDGYCGDEDNGQTSAWYVFSALGFYPVCPASTEYILGAPLFDRATIHLENGEYIVIDAKENSDANVYINKMKLNGRVYTHNYITHEALTKGARIKFYMDSTPNYSRGTADEDAPYSFSRDAE